MEEQIRIIMSNNSKIRQNKNETSQDVRDPLRESSFDTRIDLWILRDILITRN